MVYVMVTAGLVAVLTASLPVLVVDITHRALPRTPGRRCQSGKPLGPSWLCSPPCWPCRPQHCGGLSLPPSRPCSRG